MDRATDDLILGVPEDLGPCGVARHDPALVVEGDDAVGHRLEHGVVVVLHALDVVEQLGVLQRDGDLGGEGAESLLVLGRERATAFVERLGDPDGFTGLVDERNAEDRSGEEAGLGVERRVEAQIGIRVRDVDGLATGEHRAGDAHRVGEADLVDVVVSLRDASDQLGRAGVVQEERRPFGVEHDGGLGHDAEQQCVEVDLGGDVGDEIDELHLLRGLRTASLVTLTVGERQRRLGGHCLEQLQVVVVEAAVDPIQHLGDPDQLATPGADRRAQDLTGLVPGRLIDLGVEVGIVVGVVDHLATPGLEDLAGDALVVEHPDFAWAVLGHRAGVELVGGGVVQEQRRPLGTQGDRRHGHQAGKDLVEAVERGGGA